MLFQRRFAVDRALFSAPSSRMPRRFGDAPASAGRGGQPARGFSVFPPSGSRAEVDAYAYLYKSIVPQILLRINHPILFFPSFWAMPRIISKSGKAARARRRSRE